MKRRSAGFTLLEMLLALAVFALLSLMANRLLLQSLKLEQFSVRHSQRLAQIQHAFVLLERDAFAMLPRPVRGSGSFSGAPLLATEGRGDNDSLVFTHGGWPNPGDWLPRSVLQRVGYRLSAGYLIREYFDYPDVPEGTQPHRQRLLTGVSGLRVRYWQQGNWSRQWQDNKGLPEAIEVALKLAEGGTIVRRFLLPEA
ncbi:type II secretion system minor pseudopilin GspJ [Cedecea colo]|uniref:Type II secretion system protein J n=1 Tax=Cedecea colo TaxID=2552946 RepID=A0ABX0VGP3_9ENTR|nr:type II secretion system minor pseudopilin GspJ [Cedecea colo]NIY46295.1 type II secretion system protein GspJ [Cedecea colo]